MWLSLWTQEERKTFLLRPNNRSPLRKPFPRVLLTTERAWNDTRAIKTHLCKERSGFKHMIKTLDPRSEPPREEFQVCFTADKGTNVAKAETLNDWKRMECFSHRLHLAIGRLKCNIMYYNLHFQFSIVCVSLLGWFTMCTLKTILSFTPSWCKITQIH